MGACRRRLIASKVSCVTLREGTERVETVDDGWNVPLCANSEEIVEMANRTTLNPSPLARRGIASYMYIVRADRSCMHAYVCQAAA